MRCVVHRKRTCEIVIFIERHLDLCRNSPAVNGTAIRFAHVFQTIVHGLTAVDVHDYFFEVVAAEPLFEKIVADRFFDRTELLRIIFALIQIADHFSVGDIHQKMIMESAVLFAALGDAHISPTFPRVQVRKALPKLLYERRFRVFRSVISER